MFSLQCRLHQAYHAKMYTVLTVRDLEMILLFPRNKYVLCDAVVMYAVEC